MRKCALIGTVVCIGLLTHNIAKAQQKEPFQLQPTHSGKSLSLIKQIRVQQGVEMERNNIPLPYESSNPVNRAYANRTKMIEALVKDSLFLNSEVINDAISNVVNRLQESNQMTRSLKNWLAARSPFGNAGCFGEGTFYVTTGLLALIENESQLAAVLAHEAAHYELNHAALLIDRSIQDNAMMKREFRKIADGRPSAEGIIDLKRQLARSAEYSRTMEEEADSLGFVLFANAGYSQPHFERSLALLDVGDSLSLLTIKDLFSPLRFSRYRFDESWLASRPRIYNKRRSEYFMPYDSLRTHPEMMKRRKRVLNWTHEGGRENFLPDASISNVIAIARYQAIADGIWSNNLDLALLAALREYHRNPGDPYLTTTIARILLQLYEAVRDNQFEGFVSGNTSGYSGPQRKMNDFVHNLRKVDFMELGFYFMNKSSNFNDDTEVHYYLLWKFSDLARRDEIKTKVSSSYLTRFPKGKYRRLMR